MVPKLKKESPGTPKTEAKAEDLKSRKAVFEGIPSHTKVEDRGVTDLLVSPDIRSEKKCVLSYLISGQLSSQGRLVMA